MATPVIDGNFHVLSPEVSGPSITFHGEQVDALTAGEGLQVLGAINRYSGDVQQDLLNNGSSLSHLNHPLSIINVGAYTSSVFVSELDLAMLQDIGYSIDRSKYFYKSFLPYGTSLPDTFCSTENVKMEPERMMTTGYHVYRNDLTLNLSHDVNADGDLGLGVLVSGANNKVVIDESSTVSANGAMGTAVAVNYGSNNNITVKGNIEAKGFEGIGITVSSAYSNFFNEETFNLSRNDESAWSDVAGLGIASEELLQQVGLDNNGYSVDNLNIYGSVTGSRAAIFVGAYSYIHNLNLLGNASIEGDIANTGFPQWNYAAYLESNLGKYTSMNINIGVSEEPDGSVGTTPDPDFNGSINGNMGYVYGNEMIFLLSANVTQYGGTLNLNAEKSTNEATATANCFFTNPNTVTNIGGTLRIYPKAYVYPQEHPEKNGVIQIGGTLKPGGDDFRTIAVFAEEYRQLPSGVLQLDYDLNTGKTDHIILRNFYVPFTFRYGTTRFNETSSYSGTPVVLTENEFISIEEGNDVTVDYTSFIPEVSTATQTENSSARTVSATDTQVVSLRGSYALMNKGSGFSSVLTDSAVKGFGQYLDSVFSAEKLNSMSEDEYSLIRTLTKAGYQSRVMDNVRALSGLSYENQNRAYTKTAREIFSNTKQQLLADRSEDSYSVYATPMFFSAKNSGEYGYTLSGRALMAGFMGRKDAVTAGVFCGFIDSSVSADSTDKASADGNGLFAGGSLKADISDMFIYSSFMYMKENCDSKRYLNINGSYVDTLSSDYSISSLNYILGLGYSFESSYGNIKLTGDVEYSRTHNSSIGENGRSGALKISADSYDTALGVLGLNYTSPVFEFRDFKMTGSIYADYYSEFKQSDRHYKITYMNNQIPVETVTKDDRNYMKAGFTGRIISGELFGFDLSAGREFFNSDGRAYYVQADFKLLF
ncbi:MAG: hypothetical protein ACI4NE_02805 [Succinivibrio sp.]